jgi:hypothetical protein
VSIRQSQGLSIRLFTIELINIAHSYSFLSFEKLNRTLIRGFVSRDAPDTVFAGYRTGYPA